MSRLRLKKRYLFLGLVLVLSSIFFSIYIGKEITKLPDNFTYQADLVSFDNFYDREAEIYLGDEESKSRYFYETKESTSNTALVSQTFEVRQLNDSLIFSANREYGIDRFTREQIPELGDRERRVGHLFAPPGIDKGVDFRFWPYNFNSPLLMKYKDSVLKNGLELYRYEASFSSDQTEDLSFLDEVPELYNVTADINLELYVEPVTGYVVKLDDDAVVWFVSKETGEKLFPRNKFSNTYTELSYNFHVAQAQSLRNLYLIADYFIPGILNLIAIFYIALSFFFYSGYQKYNVKLGSKDTIKLLIPPSIVFMIFATLTFMIWDQYKDNLRNDNIGLFNQEAQLIETAIENRSNLYINALQAGVSLFDSSVEVDREEWKSFSEGLGLRENFPGIQGYGYSVVIPKQDLDSHIASIRSEGFSEYTVRPEDDKDEYTSIIYLEPFDERNIQAFGLDMTFETNRRSAMHSARDTGEPRMSGKVTLVQEIDEDVQPGFLMYLPQYKKDTDLDTLDGRREGLEGYVYSPFRMRDFMSGILGKRDLVLDFEIYDKGDNPDPYSEENFMYSSKRSGENSIEKLAYLEKDDVIEIANREWNIRFYPRSEFGLGLLKESTGWVLLVSGLLVSFFVSFIVYLLSISRQRAVLIADEITKELKEKVVEIQSAEEKTSAILESIGDGLVVVDKKGNIISVNKAFTDLTGLESKDIYSKKLSSVLNMVDENKNPIPEQNRLITKVISEKRKADNRSHVLEYAKSDGSYFPVAITISPIFIDGEFIGAVEVFRDITKEHEIDKAKTEFVSLASHQLRTPLTAIRWYTEMLLTDDENKLDEEKEGYVNEIRKGNRRMIDLVNSLLNVSRIELGNFAVSTEDVNIKEVLSESLDDIKILIKDKDVELVVEDNDAPESYKADPSLLRMIFQNLISNAFKYTDSGEVRVKVGPVGNQLVIEVSDTGYGIPESQKDEIFKKLFRADNVKVLDTTGTGLGLYVIKAIIEEVDGSIDFESEEGKGTKFTVKLPLDGMENIEGSKPLAV